MAGRINPTWKNTRLLYLGKNYHSATEDYHGAFALGGQRYIATSDKVAFRCYFTLVIDDRPSRTA